MIVGAAAGEWVWLDGRFLAAADATCSVLDRGIVVGDGAFETIPVVRGEPFALTRHLARLRRSLDALAIDLAIDDAELSEALRAIVDRNGEAGLRIRLTVTAGAGAIGTDRSPATPLVAIATTGKIARPPSTAVAPVEWTRNERGALAGVKSTSYAENVIALDHARRQGATEALMANTRDELCEGTGSNVFVVIDDRLLTPPVSSGCLAGITRALVTELVAVDEEAIPWSSLDQVEAAFLTSSTRDVQPVDHIGDRPLRVEHRLVTAAADALADLMARTTDP